VTAVQGEFVVAGGDPMQLRIDEHDLSVAVGLLLSGNFTVGNLLAGGVVPFLAGLLGGWLGERRPAQVGS
jgi:hypothetical protein